jgi:hypothetical protein
MTDTRRARDIARSLLEESLPRRWAHVQGAAGTAATLAPVLGRNTGPDGQRMPIGQRLADIRARYGREHLVTRALARSAPELEAATGRIACQLSARTTVPRLARGHGRRVQGSERLSAGAR